MLHDIAMLSGYNEVKYTLSKSQDMDSTIARVKTLLQRPRKPNARERGSESPEIRRYLRDMAKLSVKDGLLCRSAIVKGDSYKQLVVPKEVTDIIY